MNIETLEASKMESIRELANINSQISQGKVELSTMKKELQVFLDKREELGKERIKKLLEESSDIINQINANLSFVTNYYNEVRSFSVFLSEFHEQLIQIMQDMNKEGEGFMELVKKEETRLSSIRKEVETMQADMKEEQKQIKKDKDNIRKEHARIDARSKLLAQSYKELKKLWQKNQ